jgi:hypothetical protein
MPKIFYTERDIEDLFSSGITTLVISDDVVVTDLAREKAGKLGVELLKENDQPSSAPIRPYITEKKSPSAAPSLPDKPPQVVVPLAALEDRVLKSVKDQVGDSVDEGLLRTIIERVLKSVGGR